MSCFKVLFKRPSRTVVFELSSDNLETKSRQSRNCDQKLLTVLVSTHKQNGKQPLTKTSTTVSAPMGKGIEPPKKKMEETIL